MCGRFVLDLQGRLWPELIQLDPDVLYLKPRYNVVPTQEIPAVRNDGTQNVLQMMSWGIVPFWIKKMSDQRRYINARAETVSEKMYKNAFTHRRCLIPATGFYEWQLQPDGTKQPMFIRLTTGEPFAFAGIWERATLKNFPEKGEISSSSIITTVPNSLMEPIHDRMQVILSPELYREWLNPENQNICDLKEYLLPYDPDLVEAYPVAKLVNSIKNDGPELIERI